MGPEVITPNYNYNDVEYLVVLLMSKKRTLLLDYLRTRVEVDQVEIATP